VRERENHYAILGVTSTATAGEIRRAYLSLAKRFHPDRHHSKSVTIQYRNSERFKVIGEAYYILDDPASRRAYDLTRAGDYIQYGDEDTECDVTYYSLFDDDGYPSRMPRARDRDVILNALVSLAVSEDTVRKRLVDFLELGRLFGMDLDSDSPQENRLNRDFLRAGLFMVGRLPASEARGLTFHPIVMLDDSLMHGRLCVFTGLVYQGVLDPSDVEGYRGFVSSERKRIWRHFRSPAPISKPKDN
jgi:curved DNA-binding protein CbpA